MSDTGPAKSGEANVGVLSIDVGDQPFMVPQQNVLELIDFEQALAFRQVEHVDEALALRRRGRLVPLLDLSELLGLPGRIGQGNSQVIVIARVDGGEYGMLATAVHDVRDARVLTMAPLLAVGPYAGATIVEDGPVTLVLDAARVASLGGIRFVARADQADSGPAADDLADRRAFLVFSAGTSTRLALPISLVDRLEEFQSVGIEHSAGRAVAQYRGEILPLIDVADRLQAGPRRTEHARDPMRTIVVSDRQHRCGLVVDEILGLVEDRITTPQPAGQGCLTGSGVFGGKVTDFVDLPALVGRGRSVTEGGNGDGQAR